MKAHSLFLAVTCAVASLPANLASGFTISAVTLSPSNVVPAMTELLMAIDITTPSQGTWLYAPTQVSSNVSGIHVDVYPASGALTAIGSLRETVTVGPFPVGTYKYEVVIHPNFHVNWGTRTNHGRLTVTDELPQALTITRPEHGAEFPPDTPIEIIAEARDPDGYVPKVEFFADGRKIGEQSLDLSRPSEPGQSQTFSFVWRHPTPGSHTLTARATDRDGDSVASGPVEIRLAAPDVLPIVTVVARDPFAVEPGSDGVPNTATFLIRRFGSTNDAIPVTFSLDGTAQAGADYESFPRGVVIPPGQPSVSVTVRPLPDNLAEASETVILRLEDPPPVGPLPEVRPPGYRVGFPRRAVAVISDHSFVNPTNGLRCVPLVGGWAHVYCPAETGHNFRIEATSDFRTWETVFDAVAADGALHFVEDEATNGPHRFYRAAHEPVTEADQ